VAKKSLLFTEGMGYKKALVEKPARRDIVKAWFNGVEVTMTFSRAEDELSCKILAELAEMYEAKDIDASSIRTLIDTIQTRVTWQ